MGLLFKVKGEAAKLEILCGLTSKDKPLLYEHAAELEAFPGEVAQCWKGVTGLPPTTDLPWCPAISSGSFRVGRPP